MAKSGIPIASLSAALVIADVTNGTHRVEVRRPCYSTVSRTLDVTQLGDFVLEPMKLDSAMATLVARSTMAGTTVYVDGQQRGAAPHTMDVCEGEHTVDLRSAAGRYSRKVDARPGQNIEVDGHAEAGLCAGLDVGNLVAEHRHSRRHRARLRTRAEHRRVRAAQRARRSGAARRETAA